jgi:UDP-N-acetylglucosamine--N-acetylmuramyl-(pentapeptide) pyrophosphoryl-undecaprenol N-acetylglucosamine transferase
VALAAGGTGGHLFPAQALACQLLSRGFRVLLLTDGRGAGFGANLGQVETHAIASGGLAGIGLATKAKNVLRLGTGYLQARRRLKESGAGTLVGFGGYPAVPPTVAAAHLGLNIVLHEQNAVLGRANRALARYADRICTSFETVEAVPDGLTERIVVTGNPVRPAISEIGRRPYGLPMENGTLNVLVTGGSQGAKAFDQLVPGAFSRLPEEIRWRIAVQQQVAGDELERVREAYNSLGIRCDLAPFFDDLPARLAAAHLVICRAGASTVAELANAGRPAILVPFPFATDDHQRRNAMALSGQGAGWLMPQEGLTEENLAERLESLLGTPALLAEAAHAALKSARRNAAEALADVVCDLANPNGDRHGEEIAA